MRQGPHPVRFLLLILPYGAAFGYVTVALQYVATHRDGIGVREFAGVVAAAFAVHSVKLVFAPIVDATLSKRLWYLIALGLTMGGCLASSLMPISHETLRALTIVVALSQVGLALMGMACENFLGNLPADEKGRASGYYQAGNFIGLGLGGGLALELATSLPRPWMAAGLLGLTMVPCALALIGMPEPPRQTHKFLEHLVKLGKDIVSLVATKENGRWVPALLGIAGLVIAISPVSSNAAGGLVVGAANIWHATEGQVALVNGWLGGLIGGAGAFIGGWTADRLDRRLNYALAGSLIALSNVAWAFLPTTPFVFVTFNLLTGVFAGMAYAAFSALVLDSIGHGAVATKYNLFAMLANSAITYMTLVDGAAFGRWSARGMLLVDAACTFGGIAVVLVSVALLRRISARRPAPSAEPAT